MGNIKIHFISCFFITEFICHSARSICYCYNYWIIKSTFSIPSLMCCTRIPTTIFFTCVIIFTLILKFIIIPFFIWITCRTIKTFKNEICFTNVSTSFILVVILILLYHLFILFYLEHIFSQINHEQHYSFQMDIN